MNIYKSVLHKLSMIPEEYLDQVNYFLASLKKKIDDKEKNREEILKLAGSWSDMSELDFEEYLKKAKESSSSAFNREIDLWIKLY